MTAHRALVHDYFDAGRYAEGNGALEVPTLIGGLVALVVGGLLIELAPVGCSTLAAWACSCSCSPPPGGCPWHTWGSLTSDNHGRFALRDRHDPPGVRDTSQRDPLGHRLRRAAGSSFSSMPDAWGSGSRRSLASLWLAAFALGAGLAMVAAGFIRNPTPAAGSWRWAWPSWAGCLAAAVSANLVAVSFACGLSRNGLGLISILGFSLLPRSSPRARPVGTRPCTTRSRAVASALAVPIS